MKPLAVVVIILGLTGSLAAQTPDRQIPVTPPRSPTYPTPAPQTTDPALAQLTTDYESAFNKGDAKALAALYTADDIRLGLNNQILTGRAAIEQFYVASFAGAAKPPRLTIRPGRTQMLGPDVALTEGSYELTSGVRGVYVITAVRAGWPLATCGGRAGAGCAEVARPGRWLKQ